MDTGTGSNNGHITPLRSHGDHFHRLGVFGGAEGRIPESSAGGPLELRTGTGQSQGRFVSGEYSIPGNVPSEYSDLEIRPISTLLGSPEATLLVGGSRHLGSLAGASLAFELVSISAGLNVADASGAPILASPGGRYALGAADSFAAFTPTFYTDLGAAAGAFIRRLFRLVDLNGVAGESGTFRYEFRTAAVPEPPSVALMGAGLGVVALARARSRRR